MLMLPRLLRLHGHDSWRKRDEENGATGVYPPGALESWHSRKLRK